MVVFFNCIEGMPIMYLRYNGFVVNSIGYTNVEQDSRNERNGIFKFVRTLTIIQGYCMISNILLWGMRTLGVPQSLSVRLTVPRILVVYTFWLMEEG